MWQPRVEIEHYSVGYFAVFEALKRGTSVKGGAHTRWVNSSMGLITFTPFHVPCHMTHRGGGARVPAQCKWHRRNACSTHTPYANDGQCWRTSKKLLLASLALLFLLHAGKRSECKLQQCY